MKTLVVGLGNPILGDDGVGWRVVEAVERQTETASFEAQAGAGRGVEFDYCALGGLSLMERLIGYDRAILVDAVTTGAAPGAVVCLPLDELPDHATAHSSAAHDTSLQNAIRVGRGLGAHLPECIWVIGVEAEHVYDFSEELTPAVAEAVPRAAQLAFDLIQRLTTEHTENTEKFCIKSLCAP